MGCVPVPVSCDTSPRADAVGMMRSGCPPGCLEVCSVSHTCTHPLAKESSLTADKLQKIEENMQRIGKNNYGYQGLALKSFYHPQAAALAVGQSQG